MERESLANLRRTTAVIRLASSRRFLEQLLGNHQAMCYGHWGEALAQLAARLGMILERI